MKPLSEEMRFLILLEAKRMLNNMRKKEIGVRIVSGNTGWDYETVKRRVILNYRL